MELINKFQNGELISIDTSPFIYFMEQNQTYTGILKPFFKAIDEGLIRAITSTVTLLEVLIHPIRTDNNTLAESYRNILLHSGNVFTYSISNEVSDYCYVWLYGGNRLKPSVSIVEAITESNTL